MLDCVETREVWVVPLLLCVLGNSTASAQSLHQMMGQDCIPRDKQLVKWGVLCFARNPQMVAIETLCLWHTRKRSHRVKVCEMLAEQRLHRDQV